ncbi:alpha-2,8-sialyltransferase 8E-like [Synchiropus splendidus]|uniref:alpha-2,8-sialyltransferase 8E-like n=1 Tax=Synchiropus splendidus TaxID=270530 RepID=UPI00237EA2D4|nr:alpha-2,8-sialyltransferase 8E-like [Synchiropus splendidus]
MEKYKHVIIFIFCVALSMSTLTWHMRDGRRHFKKHNPPFKKIRPKFSELDEESQNIIEDVRRRYLRNWRKLEHNFQEIRSQLHDDCNGFDNAIMTQSNTPEGSKIIYDTSTKSLVVGKDLVKLLLKEHPFQNKTWKTCAVVGNGGILSDSNCGKRIDSADFVFRCNLPPLVEEFTEDVGLKTSLVTANPSILRTMYRSLNERRRPFAEKLQSYGNAMVLLPAFSYNTNTELCFRAAYTMEDFNVSARPVFFNPQYLIKLGKFWFSKGVNSPRLSSGLMIVSLALEVCSNVEVYGFWPYRNHPSELYSLLQHYYDDAPTNLKVHSMPQEFKHLLQLHNEGVLRLHLDVCEK